MTIGRYEFEGLVEDVRALTRRINTLEKRVDPPKAPPPASAAAEPPKDPFPQSLELSCVEALALRSAILEHLERTEPSGRPLPCAETSRALFDRIATPPRRDPIVVEEERVRLVAIDARMGLYGLLRR